MSDNKYYVYIFLDKNDNPLYVGISKNLTERIEVQHFRSVNGNLSDECIKEVSKIFYHKAISSDDMKIKERYLINKLSPKYNKQLKNNSKFSFKIDIDWNEYKFNKLELLKPKKRRCFKLYYYNFIFDKIKNGMLPYGKELLKPKFYRIKNKFYKTDNNIDYFYLLSINNSIYVSSEDLFFWTSYQKQLLEMYNICLKKEFVTIVVDEEFCPYDIVTRICDLEGKKEMPFIEFNKLKETNFLEYKYISMIEKRLSVLMS